MSTSVMSTAPLAFKARKLMDNLARKTVRIYPDTSGAKSGGQQVVFTLPVDHILDLKTLKVW